MIVKILLALLFLLIFLKDLSDLFSKVAKGENAEVEIFLAVILLVCGLFALFIEKIAKKAEGKRKASGDFLAS